jgi:AcrR family transcriptional regulator
MVHVAAPAISKGDRTRARILDEAASLASVGGIGSVTLGHLAERLGMSKSGLFAHFDSKEALQVEILDRAATQFRARVVDPLVDIPDKRARLAIFFKLWLDWIENPGLGGGCPILAAALEFDDVPGPIRETSAGHYGELYDLIRRLVRVAHPEADAEAMASTIDGLALSHLGRVRLLNEKNARQHTMRAFEFLLANPPRKELP